MNYRCPACLARDIDIDMFYDKAKGEYYCLRCAFTGDEAEVLSRNELYKIKYRNIRDRITDFD